MHFYCQAFSSRKDQRVGSRTLQPPRGIIGHVADHVVGTLWVMVAHRHHIGLYLIAKVDHGCNRVVPPAFTLLINGVGVLGVDNDQIGSGHELDKFVRVLPPGEMIFRQVFLI
jgi:hypothetical protein